MKPPEEINELYMAMDAFSAKYVVNGALTKGGGETGIDWHESIAISI